MGKVFLSQINFSNFMGARNINVTNNFPVLYSLDELSLDNSNNIYLTEPSRYNYLITTNGEDNIYINGNLAGMCKELTMLKHTDLLNKDIVNYHYVSNMHTTFANCYLLRGKPISAKRVRSMYGTYYNCTNLTGSPKVNTNVTNLIGTFYNCGKLSGAPNAASENVIAAVGTYYNCVNLTGAPAPEVSAQSIADMYYNCYLIEGNPSNCNNAFVTVNAYYNCPNIYGTFYWVNSYIRQSDIINASNMFYNRNMQNKLNIWVSDDSSILNALLDYGDTYGNIYGTGQLQWERLYSSEYEAYYFNNAITNTNIIYQRQSKSSARLTIERIMGRSSNSYHQYLNLEIVLFNGFRINTQRTYPTRVYDDTLTYINQYHYNAGQYSTYNFNVTVNVKNYFIELNEDPMTTENFYFYDIILDFLFPFVNGNNEIYSWAFNYKYGSINCGGMGPTFPTEIIDEPFFNRDYYYNNCNNRIYINVNELPLLQYSSAATTYTMYNADGYKIWPNYRDSYLFYEVATLLGRYVICPYMNNLDALFKNPQSNLFVCANQVKEDIVSYLGFPSGWGNNNYNHSIICYCPKTVSRMAWTYCGHDIQTLACGENVLYMDYTYYGCTNILNHGICGNNVLHMNFTYGFSDITDIVYGKNCIFHTYTYGFSAISAEGLNFNNINKYSNVLLYPFYYCNNIWGNLSHYCNNLDFSFLKEMYNNIYPERIDYFGCCSLFYRCSHIVAPFNNIIIGIDNSVVAENRQSFAISPFTQCSNLIYYPQIIINNMNGYSLSTFALSGEHMADYNHDVWKNLVYIPDFKNTLNMQDAPLYLHFNDLPNLRYCPQYSRLSLAIRSCPNIILNNFTYIDDSLSTSCSIRLNSMSNPLYVNIFIKDQLHKTTFGVYFEYIVNNVTLNIAYTEGLHYIYFNGGRMIGSNISIYYNNQLVNLGRDNHNYSNYSITVPV